MPRTIDLIRASKLPSNMMQFAAKGALSVPADENIEILVYLAKNNRVFGDLARMTLAGWDEKASLAAASNPKTVHEVLNYFLSPENLRPKLLPALLQNPSVSEADLIKFAVSASRESIDAMLKSARVTGSAGILKSLRSNPYLKSDEVVAVDKLLKTGQAPPAPQSAGAPEATQCDPGNMQAFGTEEAQQSSDSGQEVAGNAEDVPDEAISAYLAENAAEISSEQSKSFQPVGGMVGIFSEDAPGSSENSGAVPAANQATDAKPLDESATRKPAAPADGGRRDNTLQKINKLDVKGRIQLALKGNKEERSILIRDGTKVVALAVLEAPKLSDGEVEKFALQKNVLEAVLRQIPLKRRFMKNYVVVRNLVSNPRTPLDLGLGLMKHLLAQDLKNLSANKEVSETVRKLALKMYKQKLESASKTKS
jgi:hypothetical protein